MKSVIIEQVANGFVVKSGDQTFVANRITGSTYARTGGYVSEVLEEIFKAPEAPAAIADKAAA